jgi:hypothetical protein
MKKSEEDKMPKTLKVYVLINVIIVLFIVSLFILKVNQL